MKKIDLFSYDDHYLIDINNDLLMYNSYIDEINSVDIELEYFYKQLNSEEKFKNLYDYYTSLKRDNEPENFDNYKTQMSTIYNRAINKLKVRKEELNKELLLIKEGLGKKLITLLNKLNSDKDTLLEKIRNIQAEKIDIKVLRNQNKELELLYKEYIKINNIIEGIELLLKSFSDLKLQKNNIEETDVKFPKVESMKFSDNKYYWVVNGSWLLDKEGNKIESNTEGAVKPNFDLVLLDDGKYYFKVNNFLLFDKNNNKIQKEQSFDLGIKEDKGIIYWTFNGDFIFDINGNRLICENKLNSILKPVDNKNLLDDNIILKKYVIINEDGSVSGLYNTGDLSPLEFATNNNIDISRIGILVYDNSKNYECFITALELFDKKLSNAKKI